jgi:iron complex outermembrane receptor protein
MTINCSRRYLHFDGGVAATFTTARVTHYGDPVREYSADLYGGVRYVRERWRISATVRQTFHTDASPPPQGSAGFRWQALPTLLTLHGTLSTRYRLPALNDKYWVPGGNPSLLPEHGWGVAGGLDLSLPAATPHSWQLTWQGEGYYNIIRDQIQWVPSEGYWQPENVGEVHTRGMENSIRFSWKHRKLTLTTLLNYNLSFPVVLDDDGTAYKSRYIPENAASATLRLDYGIFFTGIYFTFTGQRYTTTDNDPVYALEPYTLANMVAGIHAGKKKTRYSLQIDIHNLFNTRYQVIRSYAMPGTACYLKGVVTFTTR